MSNNNNGLGGIDYTSSQLLVAPIQSDEHDHTGGSNVRVALVLVPSPSPLVVMNSSESTFLEGKPSGITVKLHLQQRPLDSPRCQSICHHSIDKATGRFTAAKADFKVASELLSHRSYSELADFDLTAWRDNNILRNLFDDTGDGNHSLAMDFFNECLPPVTIFYHRVEKYPVARWTLLRKLKGIKRPYVVISTGLPPTHSEKKTMIQNTLSKDPLFLRLYSSSHAYDPRFSAKAFPIPLGLLRSAFDQAPGIETAIKPIAEGKEFRTKPKLLMINFSSKNMKSKHREEPYQLFCNKTMSKEAIRIKATCTLGGFYDAVAMVGFNGEPNTKQPLFSTSSWNQQSRRVYQNWAKHKFTLCPRGLMMDTHRFWESLYLGSVPIVLRGSKGQPDYYKSLVDHYFKKDESELPILFVESWESITKELLEHRWKTQFSKILRQPIWNSWPPKHLSMRYFQEYISAGVHEALSSSMPATDFDLPPKNLSDFLWTVDRKRCQDPSGKSVMLA